MKVRVSAHPLYERLLSLPRFVGRHGVMLILGLLGMAVSSCNHKDLIMPDDGDCVLTVKFDWTNAPEAKPDGMTLYFFPLSKGTLIWRFDIAGHDGGNIELPPGSYRMLAYNNDLPRLDFVSRESFDGFAASLRMISDGVAYPPGLLYSGHITQVNVSHKGVSYITPQDDRLTSDGHIIRCYPRLLSVTYSIEVRGVTNMECLRSATACLDGLAGSLLLVADTPAGDTVTEETAMTGEASTERLLAVMTGFGTAPGTPIHTLTVKGVCTDGKAFEKSFDVSGQVLNSSDPKNVLIVVEGLDVPKVVTPPAPEVDMGIEVDVDGWNEIHINWATDEPRTA